MHVVSIVSIISILLIPTVAKAEPPKSAKENGSEEEIDCPVEEGVTQSHSKHTKTVCNQSGVFFNTSARLEFDRGSLDLNEDVKIGFEFLYQSMWASFDWFVHVGANNAKNPFEVSDVYSTAHNASAAPLSTALELVSTPMRFGPNSGFFSSAHWRLFFNGRIAVGRQDWKWKSTKAKSEEGTTTSVAVDWAPLVLRFNSGYHILASQNLKQDKDKDISLDFVVNLGLGYRSILFSETLGDQGFKDRHYLGGVLYTRIRDEKGFFLAAEFGMFGNLNKKGQASTDSLKISIGYRLGLYDTRIGSENQETETSLAAEKESSEKKKEEK